MAYQCQYIYIHSKKKPWFESEETVGKTGQQRNGETGVQDLGHHPSLPCDLASVTSPLGALASSTGKRGSCWSLPSKGVNGLVCAGGWATEAGAQEANLVFFVTSVFMV